MTDAEKIQFIVGYYGLENQLVQTAEEAAELTKAAIKRHKALKEEDVPLEDRISTQAALVEEIADVMIMIRQIHSISRMHHQAGLCASCTTETSLCSSSASIFSKDASATSSMLSSGSAVVMFWTIRLGFARNLTTGLSRCLAVKKMNS